ncbi:MAG TPA: hypothetical protein VMW25_01585 [Clostridia bacterium]|nr:hypothetical protein [Clostridia bacterium]
MGIFSGIGKALGLKGKSSGTFNPGTAEAPNGSALARIVRQAQAQNALQEGQARVAPVKAAGIEPVKAAGMKKGGKVKGSSSSASKRADGCATKGKTRGRMV